MEFLKTLFCKHEYQTFTNIHGDARLVYKCSSIRICKKCNKWLKSKEIDPNCKLVNFKVSPKFYPKKNEIADKKLPLVINLYAGPCAGKSTIAAEIYAILKRKGYNIELVREFAKDLVYRGELENTSQLEVFEGQRNALHTPIGTVDAIITDSPLLLNIVYNKTENPEEFGPLVINTNEITRSISFFIERTADYTQIGRRENKDEAINVDNKIKDMLKKLGEGYITFSYDDPLDSVISRIEHQIKNFLEGRDEC